jgi:hypothetical protein
MVYAYIDGDDIGLRLENSFMNNDEEKLREINISVSKIVSDLTSYLELREYEIIFSGADGVICKSETLDIIGIHEFIRNSNSEYKFSIGGGSCLRSAFLALRYAKSIGKNASVTYSDIGFTTMI